MREYAVGNKSQERWLNSGIPLEQYHSVEFSTNCRECLYQFKIWYFGPESMCVLVKEGSGLLERLEVGDILKMKYYATDSFYPTKDFETQISHITKEDHGRFKGHFLVGLEMLEGRNDKTSH